MCSDSPPSEGAIRASSRKRGARAAALTLTKYRNHRKLASMRRAVNHRLSRRLLSTDTSMLPNVKRKVVVLSGKGGVGKSTLAAQMAFKLASRGLRVGLLDLDICGWPSSHLLGLRGQRIGQSADQKMAPVRVAQGGLHLDVMSIALSSRQRAGTRRAAWPTKDGVVKQFIGRAGAHSTFCSSIRHQAHQTSTSRSSVRSLL